jgi:hypothetical protein
MVRAKPKLVPPEASSAFRLRGKIVELAVPVGRPEDLLRLDPADVSFRRDEEASVDTISLDGVAGIEFRRGFGAWRALPFVAYQRTEVDDPEAEDVHVLTPGLFFDRRGLYAFKSSDDRDLLRLDTSFEGSVPLDLEQDSRRARGRANITPTIRTPCGFLFGEELSCTGPLILRPEFTLITEVAWVFASGDSEELADADNYLGFGGDLSLTLRLPVVQELYGLSLKAGIRDLRLVAGDADIDDVRRWYCSLLFSPPAVPNIALELAYENGDNPETLQNEEFYKLALGIRF